MNKECYGWWADVSALGLCKDCSELIECGEEWVASGGQVGKFFDKIIEKGGI